MESDILLKQVKLKLVDLFGKTLFDLIANELHVGLLNLSGLGQHSVDFFPQFFVASQLPKLLQDAINGLASDFVPVFD